MNYDKLTKKELIYTLIARDEMLKNCRERFELHKTTDANTIQEQSDLIDVLNKALELACVELNKNINDKCEYCEYKENNIDYGSCDCDEQFETDRTVNHFKTKAKEMLKSE